MFFIFARKSTFPRPSPEGYYSRPGILLMAQKGTTHGPEEFYFFRDYFRDFFRAWLRAGSNDYFLVMPQSEARQGRQR